ncbi:MAG: polyprenyl synthetase family protein [Candidatus Marinimicrobia bacterium]|nr:polyprenyl synthetase family protein [Candidatus Neomarinimicrobiota bacterium]MBT3633516.1 polyprenyl synthetase family protein [Candidatus Neomarinimicrobiota bacterium]MBT3681658.1 polyprenyl synthetase family protein [Candidatus Neomarinimicrobiota bacterium]MBT3758374.1 polyprenyl synthetase family protein [Candidatus Neomarinimicrobiota bacterium]MBT3894972.1 polyprenyl synthetase family protein [Candidatus Neomarinimicrobiota bacterium]
MNEAGITQLRSLINSRIGELYPEGPISLTKTIEYVLTAGGKRLRPLLTMISANSCGANFEKALPSALAVEILHNFTLVHDDIMDEDQTRHGKPTVHEKWDVGSAILTGDAMLSLALLILQEEETPRDLMTVFTKGLLRVCEGQAFDKEFETIKNISLDDYVNMVDLKTGHLLGLAGEMGAIIADADLPVRYGIRDYGRLIGRAFQVQDDLLEIYSNSDNMGKSLNSDILLGKKTYLMILAKNRIPVEIQSAIELCQEDINGGKKAIQELFIESGIVKSTKQFIMDNIEEANTMLTNLDIDCSDLLYFSDLITRRNN